MQLPANPSLSLTLSECYTEMTLRVNAESSKPSVQVFYDGKEAPLFLPKIQSYFNRIRDSFPWLHKSSVTLDSVNTFPHGAGIASSASAMSALALCLMDVNDKINDSTHASETLWWQKVSEIARLGSGSACRSIYPYAALWGKTENIENSSDEYAIPWAEKTSPVFKDYQDTILIVSAREKKVSSSAGHELMSGHPHASIRYTNAKENLNALIKAMSNGSGSDEFITICESEALQLHSLMMMSRPPFILMEAGTVSIIKEIWTFRAETNLPVCFTLDAGPNVHLLYPSDVEREVKKWIHQKLIAYCHEGQFINDKVGTGPIRLK